MSTRRACAAALAYARGEVRFISEWKTFERCRAAASLRIHSHQLVADAETLADRGILQYHFRGFPEQIEETPYRLPIERQALDLVDARPWQLLQPARHDPGEPTEPSVDHAVPRDDPRTTPPG